MLVERGGHADDQGIDFAAAGKVCGGTETLGAGVLDKFGGQALDVALAVVEQIDLVRVDVKAQYLAAGFGKAQCQRQSDIAKAVDADGGLAVVQALLEGVQCCHARFR